MEKKFRTIKQQIQILKSKNLQCEEKRAAYILENNNYYYLINGYKHLFLNSISKKEKFVEKAKSSSIYDTGITASYGDDLITLITCSYHVDDGRFVVIGRKFSVGDGP